MNYDQAMTTVETSATTRRNTRRPLYRWWTWGTGICVIVSGLFWCPHGPLKTHVRGKNEPPVPTVSQRASIPLASRPVSEWPKLTMPPKGRSETVIIPPGERLSWSGINFEIRTIYADGHECGSEQSCPGGETVMAYAVNEANVTNTVSYALATH